MKILARFTITDFKKIHFLCMWGWHKWVEMKPWKSEFDEEVVGGERREICKRCRLIRGGEKDGHR